MQNYLRCSRVTILCTKRRKSPLFSPPQQLHTLRAIIGNHLPCVHFQFWPKMECAKKWRKLNPLQEKHKVLRASCFKSSEAKFEVKNEAPFAIKLELVHLSKIAYALCVLRSVRIHWFWTLNAYLYFWQGGRSSPIRIHCFSATQVPCVDPHPILELWILKYGQILGDFKITFCFITNLQVEQGFLEKAVAKNKPLNRYLKTTQFPIFFLIFYMS